jgi:hypothetical protein
MRWEGVWAWASEKLIESEKSAMEKIEGRMDDLGMWAREGSQVIGSGWVFFEASHRKEDVSSLFSRR